MLRTITLAYSWARSSNKKSLFYNKVLNFSCNLLNKVLKVKIRVVVRLGKVRNIWVLLHSWPLIDWETQLVAIDQHQHQLSVTPWTTAYQAPISIYCILLGPRKDQNSQFQVQFWLKVYCFCTIMKSRNYKLNHQKIGDHLYNCKGWRKFFTTA